MPKDSEILVLDVSDNKEVNEKLVIRPNVSIGDKSSHPDATCKNSLVRAELELDEIDYENRQYPEGECRAELSRSFVCSWQS